MEESGLSDHINGSQILIKGNMVFIIYNSKETANKLLR